MQMVANKTKPSNDLGGNAVGRVNGISQKSAIELFGSMLRIRRVEEALIEEYHPADEMRCPVHFCVGQEGPPAGVCLNLREDDYLFSGHRSHGYYLGKGGSLQGMFAELYGKATGSNGGKAGHQEISDEAANFYSGTILVGTLPIAAGVALASQMRREDRVVIAVLGDGGADQGIVYETLNFAAVKNLPMVFICENNSYSIYSRQETRQAPADLSGRARAFGVPAKRMYGNDSLGVYRAAKRAIQKARSGAGPSFLEMDTYRYCGHVGPESDDHLLYRTEEELDMWKDLCPIENLKGTLLEAKILDGESIENLEQQISGEISDAFSFAKSSPFPEPSVLMKDVFSNGYSDQTISLKEIPELPFDAGQAEAIPRPY
jgi:pyruvate dehydrogenase E1 component alpha subunit